MKEPRPPKTGGRLKHERAKVKQNMPASGINRQSKVFFNLGLMMKGMKREGERG